MSQVARVHSIDALRDFRVSLVKFTDEARQALDAVDVEIQRTFDWLTHDQLRYWKSEVRKREEAVNEAKQELHRCLLMTTASGDRPSCYDQRKALEKAKARLEEAHEKVEKVKHWTQVLQQEIMDYRGPAQQLSNLVVAQVPRSIELLERMSRILEAYAEVSPGQAAQQAQQSMSAGAPRKPIAPPEPDEQQSGESAPPVSPA